MDCVVYKEGLLAVSNDCTEDLYYKKVDVGVEKSVVLKINDLYFIKGELIKDDEVGVICDNGEGYFCIFANNTFKIKRNLSDLEIKQQKKIWRELKVS